MRRNPGIWETVGNLGEYVRHALIEGISGGRAVVRESLENTCQEMLRELTAPQSGLVTHMAAQRVVIAWLELQFADLQHLQPSADPAQARFQLQCQQSAQKRFERAVRTWKLIGGENHSRPVPNKPQVAG